MSADNLMALAERCEGARGPDRGLDVHIWATINGVTQEHVDAVMFCVGLQLNVECCPFYTGSLDAAVQFVPEGPDRWPQIIYRSPNPNNGQQDHRVELWPKGANAIKGRSKASFALALTACALRARAQDGGQQ